MTQIRILFLLILLPCVGWSQSNFKISNDSILIGGQLLVQNEIPFSQGIMPEQLYAFMDSIEAGFQAPFEVVKSKDLDTITGPSGKKLVKEWQLTSFDTLGGLLLDTAKGFPALFITVVPFPTDTTNALVDIFEIYESPITWDEYLSKYWWLLVLFVIGILGMYLVLRIKRNKRDLDEEQEVIIDPFEEALERLETLKSRTVQNKAELKEFYSEVSYAIRDYLSKTENEPILEWGLTEIKAWAVKSKLDTGKRNTLIALLERGDLIKFARADAPGEMASEDLKESITLVRDYQAVLDKIKEKQENEQE